MQYILDNSGAKLLLADAGLLAPLTDLNTAGLQVWTARGELPGVARWETLRDASPTCVAPAAPARGAMSYTSGTTGRPKGIVRHALRPEQVAPATALRQLANGVQPGVQPGMRALLSAPWYHSAPNSFALAMVQENAVLYIEERFDAERTLQQIHSHRLTHAYLVPTMYVRMLALPTAVRRRYDLSSMRAVSSTGSPCPPQVKREMIAWWGLVINECYGASELGYMTMLTSEQALRKPGSAGLPMAGVVMKTLDKEGREQPAGTPGLIYIDQPATPDFSCVGQAPARQRMERDGLKTMGDAGYLDDEGLLFIVVRQSDMVISGGVNIYPVEVESVLYAMPGVADCAVFGIPNEEFGEALAAAVQLAPGATVSEQVRGWLHARIAGYKVPRAVSFHAQLPCEDTGKTFKRKLREPYWEGRTRRV